jgi:hypothetical protein
LAFDDAHGQFLAYIGGRGQCLKVLFRINFNVGQ